MELNNFSSNTDLLNKVYDLLEKEKRIILTAPSGYGKTALMEDLLKKCKSSVLLKTSYIIDQLISSSHSNTPINEILHFDRMDYIFIDEMEDLVGRTYTTEEIKNLIFKLPEKTKLILSTIKEEPLIGLPYKNIDLKKPYIRDTSGYYVVYNNCERDEIVPNEIRNLINKYPQESMFISALLESGASAEQIEEAINNLL